MQVVIHVDVERSVLLEEPLDRRRRVPERVADELLKRNACKLQVTFGIDGAGNISRLHVTVCLGREPAPRGARGRGDPAPAEDLLDLLDVRQVGREDPFGGLDEGLQERIHGGGVASLQRRARQLLVPVQAEADDALDLLGVESP